MKKATSLMILSAVLLSAAVGAHWLFPGSRSSIGPLPDHTSSGSSGLPGLVILGKESLEGIGLLIYSNERRRYELKEGYIHTYFVEGSSFREGKRGGDSGSLAVPSSIQLRDGRFFVMFPSYNSLAMLDPNFSLIRKGQFGPFDYAGSASRHMSMSGDTLYFFKDGSLIAWSEELVEIGRLSLGERGDLNQFIIAGDRLYFLLTVDTRPAVDSLGRRPGGEAYILAGVIDITSPAHMVPHLEKVTTWLPEGSLILYGVDPRNQQWWTLGMRRDGSAMSQQMEIRQIGAMEQIVAKGETVPIVGMTSISPFWAVVDKGRGLFLISLRVDGHSIAFGDPVDLGLQSAGNPFETVKVKRNGDRLFIVKDYHLRVVNVAGSPRVELSQDFQDDHGIQFTIEDFDFGAAPPGISSGVNRERLSELLHLEYFANDNIRLLRHLIEQLTPRDEWAVAPLTDALRKGGSVTVVHPILAEGLGNIGPAAQSAIPALLDASMQGAAIRGDYAGSLVKAIKKIDPSGKKVIPELALFEKSHYTPGARHIAQEILSQLEGELARKALQQYQR